MKIEFTRRQFLAAGAAAATLPHLPAAFGQTPALTPDETWARRTKRWAQLTLAENDAANFDLDFWLDYLRRTNSDGLCFSAGGCVAYYPTEVPFHHRSAWLGKRDIVGEVVEACHKRNIAVLLRTDPHATYDDAAAAHPEWIACTADGKPRRHWASPEMWVTCALGPYNFDFMTAVHREIMQRYKPEGIFLNRWAGSGDCYCAECRKNFKKATGFELPAGGDPQDPVQRAFIRWRQQRFYDCIDRWNETIRAVRPDSSMIPNNASGALIAQDALELSKRAPMLVADRQARHGTIAPWVVGKTAKEYRATLGSKPNVSLFGVGLEEPYRWKDSVQDGPEIRIWVLEEIAHGARPWWSKFATTLHDRRWLPVVEDVYSWAAANERYLNYDKPIARVGIVYSQTTAWFYGGKEAQAKVEDFALGWCGMLTESRIPYEMVHEGALTPENLNRFRILILPNIACLSDAQAQQLRAFVQAGGSIVATYETGLYREDGSPRKDFALADLFGARFTGKREPRMQNSYLRLEMKRAPHSPILAGFSDTERIINGVSRVVVEPSAHDFAETPITLIPTYPDLPMEKVYPRTGDTHESQLYLRQLPAGGRVAYFPFDIDRTFNEVLTRDHLRLMRNTVEWSLQEHAPIESDGHGLVDMVAWHNTDAVVVHMVNLTNPMTMKGPYRDFFAIGPQTITLRLPELKGAKTAKLLVAKQTIPVTQDGETARIEVPGILDHEVVAIDL
ncbi:alpha-amylase family protein [Edaphobacter sp. 12200R-103]|uniref:alpha-amylase family protein n=1 Tax=Edaphobacter sp. 12200R-103 TaxID=2703788 RepID=UPI00138BE350|nr:beta-galactosidase trimerization domain-containing protein [Edaphobacter sp. 12200R-103]QHS52643.1 family 10 glycosylhydrolase [Edaphobacter sp. 12200R-103]